MIDAPVLLKSLKRLEQDLEDDLRTRVTPDAATSPQEQAVASELDAKLRAQYREARDAGRTANAFEVWRDEFLTQVAVAWILGCVFVRFMEDNGLVETPRLSGPGERRQRALDQHELYFKDPERRTHSDREYLLDVFEQTQKLPAARELFDAKHNPLWAVGLSGDGATKLLQFWQRLDPETGALDHDFTDPDWNTRFLGDLYQDLSESARKKYALLQTPEFVEEFILDRTLTPAIEEFGFQEVRLIDPTCGSGHFLLGAFHRLFDLWVKHEPGANPRELVQRALDQVYGVDLNPFAVVIARFRLLVEALKACGVKQLEDAPTFHENLAVGDSLLHGKRLGDFASLALASQPTLVPGDESLRHVYETEDAEALHRILGQPYHAVVGNPPYITMKDKALNQAYRDAYSSCHRQYSLGVPFTERFFDLAVGQGARESAGFVGLITANSFMKREFGKKLIQVTLPKLDLTHVIDTSGAYIPGHGTPTVILFGRARPPVSDSVRAAMGIRGEPETPVDAATGRVWQAIASQIDIPGSESEFISVADYPRDRFRDHPWSLGGGGAAELKELLEAAAGRRLSDVAELPIGRAVRIGADEAFIFDEATRARRGWPQDEFRQFVVGEIVRDWSISPANLVWYPYPSHDADSTFLRDHWRRRTTLANRGTFQGVMADAGLHWFEYMQHTASPYLTPLSITFAFVATHNHFGLDRGGAIFNKSAPVIKLAPSASESDHLDLLALLNSSTACFWMKQVFHCKGAQGINEGGKEERWEQFHEFTGTGLQELPLASAKLAELSKRLLQLGRGLQEGREIGIGDLGPTAESVAASRKGAALAFREAISIQEELDWACYSAYGLLDENLHDISDAPPPIDLGQRAFEIAIARRMVNGEIASTWFERHGSDPIVEVPTDWPEDYRRRVERRIARIESDRNIRLLEQPEYKRRWNAEQFEEASKRALRVWLLNRLESTAYWSEFEVQTTAQLSDRASRDLEFMQVAELFSGRPDYDASALVRELVEVGSVPVLKAARYKASGLRKRALWESTWELQRKEDAIDARVRLPADSPQHLTTAGAVALKQKEIGEIPVPPKYASADFEKTHYWRQRGKLDVARERFVSFPHCERAADPSPVVGWAGWSHLELAQATAAYYLEMKEQEGWPADRLTPLLLALLETLPWVKQWHNDLDPQNQVCMGDYFEDFVNEEARALGLTIEQIESWTPPKKTRTAKPRKKAARKKKTETEARPA